jgi:hypothetical protein
MARPASPRRMFSTITRAAEVARVSDAIWGVTVTLGWAQKGCSGGRGSVRKTSSVAWPTCPLSRAASKRVVVDQGAAAGVYDDRALGQEREGACVQGVFRGWRVGQEQDDDLRLL